MSKKNQGKGLCRDRPV